MRNQGPDRDKQKTQILGTEPSRKKRCLDLNLSREERLGRGSSECASEQ